MTNGPTLAELFRLFRVDPPAHVEVAPAGVPEPYRRLLVHPHHMTVTVEEFYGGPVGVRVMGRIRHDETYSRMILLEHLTTRRVVQFGIVRIRLNHCSDAVREAILGEATPLGRILIEHDVLRRIEPTAFLRVEPGPVLDGWFGRLEPTYGRLGIIHCDGRPAVELLEVLAPIPSDVALGKADQAEGGDDRGGGG